MEANALAARLRRHSSALEESASENDPPEPDGDSYESGGDSSPGISEGPVAFDIVMLFSEL
jgi:hypothetical protein